MMGIAKLLEKLFPVPVGPSVMRTGIRFPSTMQEARKVFRRYNRNNGRYSFTAISELDGQEMVFTVDSDCRIIVKIGKKSVEEYPEYFGKSVEKYEKRIAR